MKIVSVVLEIVFKGAGANRFDGQPAACFVIVVFAYRVLKTLTQDRFLFRSQIVVVV